MFKEEPQNKFLGLFKRKFKQTYTMTFNEHMLLLETRNFMLSLVMDNTHRLTKWQKTLGEGSVFYQNKSGEIITLEMATTDRKKIWLFKLNTIDSVVELSLSGSCHLYYEPLDEINLIEETKDILQLTYYSDFIKVKDASAFRANMKQFDELINKMSWNYVFDYAAYGEKLKQKYFDIL